MIREMVLNTEEVPAVDNLEFIGLSVCPEYNSAYKENLFRDYGLDKENYRRNGEYFNKSGHQFEDLRSTFNSLTYDINEILRKLKINTSNRDTPKLVIDFDEKNVSEHVEITTKYWFSFGRCYSIQLKDHVLELRVRSIIMYARMGVYIYFGYPGQFMHPNYKSKVYYEHYLIINIYQLYELIK